MNRGKYLVKNTMIFALGNLGTKLINFFLVPLYTSILCSTEYGTADLIFTICTFAVPIIICNIYESVMRFCLDKDADSDKVMSVGLLILVTSFFTGMILLELAKFYEPTSDYYIYVYLYAISMGTSQVFLCYLRGRELLLQYSIGNIIQALLIATLNVFFLIELRMGVKGYLTAYIIANFATGLYAFLVGDVWHVLKNFKIDKELSVSMIRYSIVLIPNSFMWWIMNSVDRVMLTSIVGVAATGIYAVANKIPSLVSVISTIFNQAFSYSAIKENESEDRNAFNNRIFEYLLSLVIFTGIVLIILIKPFMSIYVSDEYYEAWIYAPTLIVGTCILVLGTFLSTSYTVHKDSKGFLFSASIGAVVNILLNFILIPSLGILGASIATSISYFVVMVYRSFDVKKYITINVFAISNVLSLLSLIVVCILSYMDFIIGYVLMIVLLLFNVVIFKNNWKQFWNITRNIINNKC